MQRIFFWIVLLFVGQWLWRRERRQRGKDAPLEGARPGSDSGRRPGWPPQGAAAPRLPEPMVRCAECGAHAPLSESVVVGARHFCSAEHARIHADRPVGRDGR
jgi:uncharacterized protein